MNSLNDPSLLAADIAAIAAEYHKDLPQYEGHWEGPEWYRVRFVERVNTKFGIAFEPGDVTIAHDVTGEDDLYPTAYSLRNHIDTAVYPSSFERF